MSGSARTADRPLDPTTTSAQERMLRGNPTRHLAAAAYLDPVFRGAVLHHLLARRDQAVAPAFSTDAVPVVRHALNARRHQVARDAVLTGILLVFLVVAGKVLLALLAVAAAALLVLRSLKALAQVRLVAAIALWIPIGILLIVAAALVQSGSSFVSLPGSPEPYETQNSFSSLVWDVLGVVVVVLGAAWTTVVVERLVHRQIILDHLMPRTFVPADSPTGPSRYQTRIDHIGQAQTGNITYYPDDGQPFVGVGAPVHTWTRAVPLPSTGEGLTTETLRDALSVGLARLNETELDEVSVQDRLVTPAVGGGLRSDPQTGLLRHRLPPDEMERLVAADPTGTHRYLAVRTAPGRGDYEIWVFVRCLVQARTLNLDLIACCLPPVRACYREIDRYTPIDRGVVTRTALGALPDLPELILRAPVRLLLAVTGQDNTTGDLRTRLRQIGSSAGRGARAGVRELGADPESGNLLADLAMQRPVRAIEQRALDTIADSLERAGFDPEEFRRRTQVILDGPAQ